MSTWQRTDSRPQQLQMSRHVVQLRLLFVLYFSVHVSQLLGQMHISFRVSGRNWRTCHITRNQSSINASLSHTQRTCPVLRGHIVWRTAKERTIRNNAQSRIKIAQQLPQSRNTACIGAASRNTKGTRNDVTEFHRTDKNQRHTFFRTKEEKKHINDTRRATLSVRENETESMKQKTTNAKHVQQANLWRRWWPNNKIKNWQMHKSDPTWKRHQRILVESASETIMINNNTTNTTVDVQPC